MESGSELSGLHFAVSNLEQLLRQSEQDRVCLLQTLNDTRTRLDDIDRLQQSVENKDQEIARLLKSLHQERARAEEVTAAAAAASSRLAWFEKQNAAMQLRLREEQQLVNQQLNVAQSLAEALEAVDSRHPQLRSAAVRASLVMHPRNDYATFELCPTSLGASRAVRTAAGANDDVSAGADAVVPILLGRTGQQAPVVGGAAQEHVHQVSQKLGDEPYA